MTMYFCRLHLFAVNADHVTADRRAKYLWASCLWLLSLEGACVVTKRNILAETIALVFLVYRDDVCKARGLTSEGAEHFFGILRTIIPEFTVLQFTQLIKRARRRVASIFEGNFTPSTAPKKGYQATFGDYVKSNKEVNPKDDYGTVDVSANTSGVGPMLWDKEVCHMMKSISKYMKSLLTLCGIDDAESTPFCVEFESCTDLRDKFIAFSPNTFEYTPLDDNGDENEAADNNGEPPADEGKVIHNRFINHATEFCKELLSEEEDPEVQLISDGKRYANECNKNSNQHDIDDNDVASTFRSLLSCQNKSMLMKLAQEGIRTLDMKNREKGRNDMVQKTKGLVQRWIVFTKREGSKSDDDAKSKNGVLIKRNVIFSMRCTIGKGRDKKEITAMYRVLTLHKKYYNK